MYRNYSFITSHGIIFAVGVSVMGIKVTFCSARYNFKTCDFTPEAVNMNRLNKISFHALLLTPIFRHSVWSVIAAHKLTPNKVRLDHPPSSEINNHASRRSLRCCRPASVAACNKKVTTCPRCIIVVTLVKSTVDRVVTYTRSSTVVGL